MAGASLVAETSRGSWFFVTLRTRMLLGWEWGGGENGKTSSRKISTRFWVLVYQGLS